MLQECCCCPVLGESCWCCRVLQVAVWRGGVLQVLLSKCRSCLAWRCAAGAAVQVQELSGVEEGAAGAAVQVQELLQVAVQQLLYAVQKLQVAAGAAAGLGKSCCPAWRKLPMMLCCP
jgi:hypothetical protein